MIIKLLLKTFDLRKVFPSRDSQVVHGLLQQVRPQSQHVAFEVRIPLKFGNIEWEEGFVCLDALLVEALDVVVGEIPLSGGEVRQDVTELVNFGVQFCHSKIKYDR